MPQLEQPLETTVVRPSQYEVPPPPLPSAPAGYPGAPEFTAGAAIGKTLQVWWKNLGRFSALSLAWTAPFAVWAAAVQRRAIDVGRDPALGRDAVLWTFGVVCVVWVVMTVATGAMTHGAFGHLRGERVSFGALLATGLRRGPAVFGVTFVSWLAIVFGMILLVAPGVMLACAWAAAVPAVVVERLGPFAALRRSAALTRGDRWKVLGTFAALFGVVWGLSAVIQLATTSVALLALSPERAPSAILVVTQLGQAFFSAIPLIGSAVVHHELRAAKEGLDGSRLATVFD
ncbi:hypothetical protein [Anaeromyxobacter oryzisoli]|uniref:hypothetical protein n=1 Tax=Anaeromyxobacter oryzisoli TaxID=2925408 RepID=UPI001F5A5898|nr:hypothetical protein [Anaeromyxobacter sp. SG63]